MAMVEPQQAGARLIEIGWLAVGRLSGAQQEALHAARDRVLERLRAHFPDFHWAMPIETRPDSDPDRRDEPADRLLQGATEREARAWDFTLVVTPRDLRSHYKSHALAVPSRALAVAVLSLARLAPSYDLEVERLARRIAGLALHLFGDLNGLWHRDDGDRAMCPPESVEDLDGERGFDEDEIRQLAQALGEVADLRLEETSTPPGGAAFYLRAGFERLAEIASAVVQARPWEFPFRLSRLTTAAFSALFLLVLTAEVWDLGTSQGPGVLALLSAVSILGSTVFLLLRQKLLLRRTLRRISEQAVVMNVSATLVVLFGMVTTYAVLFGLTAAIGFGLFDAELLVRWAPDWREAGGGVFARLRMAAFVGSLGLVIGSLGASFEGQHHFRHVIYADEET